MARKAAKKSAAKKTGRNNPATTAGSKKTAAKKTKRKTAPPNTPASKGLMADVQHLMEMMAANDVTEVDILDGDRKIAMKRGTFAAPAAPPASPAVAPAPAPAASAPPVTAEPAETPPAENLLEIVSPMVGTFYAAPSPDSDPYVATGAKVGQETVVCIVEAMKVMNEIKAECSGTIAEICVKNAEPVEFGQVLFRVRP